MLRVLHTCVVFTHKSGGARPELLGVKSGFTVKIPHVSTQCAPNNPADFAKKLCLWLDYDAHCANAIWWKPVSYPCVRNDWPLTSTGLHSHKSRQLTVKRLTFRWRWLFRPTSY